MAGRTTRLLELAGLFARLGATAFGGPAAHIALMEHEVVDRRRWLTRDAFLDYLGVTQLIPGPNSTEMALHIGYVRAGWQGLLVAGISFILPAAIVVCGIAQAYVRYGTLPELAGVLSGVKPVVIAVVAHALWSLGRTALKRVSLLVMAMGCIACLLAGVHELVVLAAAAAVSAAVGPWARPPNPRIVAGIVAGAGGASACATLSAAVIAAPSAATFSLSSMFLVFLKIGSVLFGSGYVLLAFLRADFVDRLGWLTNQQILDATAVGLVTPGPVFTTATFIGYLLGDGPGALLATVGIFLPAFVFVALSGAIVPRLRRSPGVAAVLDGVNVASLALMALVAWQLGRTALISPASVVLAVASGLLLARGRINPTWLLLAGALVGLLTT